MTDSYHQDAAPRRWPIILPTVLMIVLGIGWSGLWYYVTSRAETEIAGLRAREAAQGRVQSCASETIGGYPFRIELRCASPAVSLQKERLALAARDALFAVQIYQPNLMIGEFTGPLTIGEPGQPPQWALDWSLAQASVRGLSREPERISIVLDNPALARPSGAPDGNPPGVLAKAAHSELHIGQAPRLPQDPPVYDLAVNLRQAIVAGLAAGTPAANQPIDADITATLRGLRDLSPKPLPQRLRDLQAANGRLDITNARVVQGDITAVGQGTLALTPAGRLDGQIRLTVVGLEQVMTAFGIDKKVGQASQSALDRLAPGLNLDRMLGGRGGAAIAAAGVAMLGQPAELDGKRAVALPLRFTDGVVFLGPIRVGEMPPLF